MTDPTPNKILFGKRDDKTNSKDPTPKKIMSGKKSNLAGLFQNSPSTPTAATTPTFLRPDGFAAGKKKGEDCSRRKPGFS